MSKLCSWPHCDNRATVIVRQVGDNSGVSVCNEHERTASAIYTRLGYQIETIPLDPKLGTKPIHQPGKSDQQLPTNVIRFPVERTRREEQ
jgi:hypothetical protein